MKIKIRMEIEVDEAAWSEMYGTPKQRLATDVEDYLLNQVLQSPASVALDLQGYSVHAIDEGDAR